LEGRAETWMTEIDRRGGMLGVVESGWVEGVLAEQAYDIQRRIESGESPIVGVNVFTQGNEEGQMPNVFRTAPGVEQEQQRRLADVRRRRDSGRVADALATVRGAAVGNDNLMPAILDAVRALASEGEIFRALRSVWGQHRPGAVY